MRRFPERTERSLAALAIPGEVHRGGKLPGCDKSPACNLEGSPATSADQAGQTLPDLVLNLAAATIAAGAVVAIGLLAIARLQ